MTLDSGDIRFMRIFAEVPWGGASNDSVVVDNGNFQRFRWLFLRKLFRDEASVIKYSDTQSVVGFSVIPKCVTSNDLEWLFRVEFGFYAPVWLAPTVRRSKNNCAETIKDRHTCLLSAVQIFDRDLISGNIRFVQTADVRSGSVERRRKTYRRTVGSRVNARLEHLFLAFENNCVKLNTDRPHAIAAAMYSGTLVSGNIKLMRVFAGVLL